MAAPGGVYPRVYTERAQGDEFAVSNVMKYDAESFVQESDPCGALLNRN